jgi:hypothetical protein
LAALIIVSLGPEYYSFELVNLLTTGEESISGRDLLSRATDLDYCQLAASRQGDMLLAHERLIPQTWQDYYLVLAGELLTSQAGTPVFDCLRYDGRQWRRTKFGWLDCQYDNHARLLCFNCNFDRPPEASVVIRY